jgi:hypothetical protein
MALLSVNLCPDILTDVLLKLFNDELKVKTVKDFLAIEPQKLVNIAAKADNADREIHPLSGRPLTLQDVHQVRQKIFDKFSVIVMNLGESSGSLDENAPIITGISDLVCSCSTFVIIKAA